MHGEVFISYSHDNVEHVNRILKLSNKLRSEGIDCVLDQYETSPPEGWPRWMDRKIRNAEYVLMICTEQYYKRVMGEEEPGKGHGVMWEGNLIYQHIYNSGTHNLRFIPVIFESSHKKYIPVPLQASTYYCIDTETGYNHLYLRLLGKPKVEKPKLGKLRSLPLKEVKTDIAHYLAGPIDVDLWNKAKWGAIVVACYPDKPPTLGIAFENEQAAVSIFKGWHQQYGTNDEYEEIRISIIEGDIDGEDPGYSVHIGTDPDAAFKKFKDQGQDFDRDLLFLVSRIHRMTPSPDSKNLKMFKKAYKQFKSYYLAPAVISPDKQRFKPMFDLGIFKSKIHFRDVSEIKDDDMDFVVLKSGEIEH